MTFRYLILLSRRFFRRGVGTADPLLLRLVLDGAPETVHQPALELLDHGERSARSVVDATHVAAQELVRMLGLGSLLWSSEQDLHHRRALLVQVRQDLVLPARRGDRELQLVCLFLVHASSLKGRQAAHALHLLLSKERT